MRTKSTLDRTRRIELIDPCAAPGTQKIDPAATQLFVDAQGRIELAPKLEPR